MKKLKIHHTSDFELDLAALLAVIMKLVPVLLLSSAFMQLMVIETELPQAVTQAIQKQTEEKKKSLLLEVDAKRKVTLTLEVQGEKSTFAVEGLQETIDRAKLHATLQQIKQKHPDIFKIDFSPDSKVSYKEVVNIMDEARRSRNQEIRFPVKDETTGQDLMTDYMFPEIVFVNMMEG
ncbi:MAG: ExbD/TolR family protein [Bdellovibrionales bacterium]